MPFIIATPTTLGGASVEQKQESQQRQRCAGASQTLPPPPSLSASEPTSSMAPSLHRPPSRNAAGALSFVLQCGVVLVAAAACSAATPAAPATQPVADVLARSIGAEAAGMFTLALDSTMEQGFTLSTTAAPHGGGAAAVHVVASGLPELAYGAGYYLRKHCLMSFSWARYVQHRPRVTTGARPMACELHRAGGGGVLMNSGVAWRGAWLTNPSHPASAAGRSWCVATVPVLLAWLDFGQVRRQPGGAACPRGVAPRLPHQRQEEGEVDILPERGACGAYVRARAWRRRRRVHVVRAPVLVCARAGAAGAARGG